MCVCMCALQNRSHQLTQRSFSGFAILSKVNVMWITTCLVLATGKAGLMGTMVVVVGTMVVVMSTAVVVMVTMVVVMGTVVFVMGTMMWLSWVQCIMQCVRWHQYFPYQLRGEGRGS